jgi:hypothetical protein
VAAVPSFPPGRFVFNPRILVSGRVSAASWGLLSSRVVATISALEVDELVVSVSSHEDESAPDARAVLSVHLERLVDEVPFFVAWCAIDGPAVKARLAGRGWHLWTLSEAARWDRPEDVLTAEGWAREDRVVATWWADSPLEVSRAVLGLLHDGLGLRALSRLHFDVSRVSAKELRRRQAEAAATEQLRVYLRRRGFRGFVNPVRGRCTVCGQPLRDPQSLRRGVGPDCWERVGMLGPGWSRRPDLRADVPARLWVGAKRVSTFRKTLRRRLMAAVAPTGEDV